MLERVVPHSVACAETTSELDVELFAEELDAIEGAVERRRREFVSGRACARRALDRLGAPVVAIARGPSGEPLWPPGVVGSVTHCDGFRACAVARSDAVLALGIDAEPDAPLPEGVLEQVVHGGEHALLAGPPPRGAAVDLPRLLFSAKEAVYKAWFPLTGRWLGFEDVELSLDPAGDAFRARLLVDDAPVSGFDGRWTTSGGIIATAVVLPRSR